MTGAQPREVPESSPPAAGPRLQNPLGCVDPALQAVDADLYPYVSVYVERDRFGILIPGNWRPGFEVFDLALGLHDYVFGREALIGFGKETHKRGQAGCSLPVIQLISTG